MADPEPTLPPCGHTDRLSQLTEIALQGDGGRILLFLACSVPSCPEYCRVFADLRDPLLPEAPEPFGGPPDPGSPDLGRPLGGLSEASPG